MNEPAEPATPTVDRGGWLWVFASAGFGVAMRLLAGELPEVGAMSLAFLVGTPLAMGALTALGSSRRPPGWIYCLLMPWASVGLALAACLLVDLEGTICIVLMLPLFLGLASVGGLFIGLALRMDGNGTRLRGVALLPVALLLVEGLLPLQQHELEIRRAVSVAAPPSVVWAQIMSARQIAPEELPFSLSHAMGVPRPVEGVNVRTPEGEVRYSKWEHGVHFDALVLESETNRSIHWQYRFAPDSFPPGTMDEHVAIGGRYFRLHDTTFNLKPLPGGRTELEIVAHYTVASTINFYAVPVSRVLGRDFVDTILGLYKGRSERASGAARARTK